MPEQVVSLENAPINELPRVFKDVILLSPGVWNGIEYTGSEIQKAYENTDWAIKQKSFLYLDHQDTKSRGVETWAGYVRNVRMLNNELHGDLEIWHPWAAFYLSAAKAQFGVSATLRGFENKENNLMQNFKYISWSIVTDPACKPAMINLGSDMTLGNNEELVIVTLGKLDLVNEIKDESELSENMMKCSVCGEMVPKEEMNAHMMKMHPDKMEMPDKMEPSKEKPEDMSDSSKKMKGGIKKEMEQKIEEVPSELQEIKAEDLTSKALSELSAKLDKLIALLSQDAEAKLEKNKQEVDARISTVEKELSKLSEAPDRKTLSVGIGVDSQMGKSDSNEGMIHFLSSLK